MAILTQETAGKTNLHQRFRELANQWKCERGPHSSSACLAEHPAYQAIIDLGPEAVPLILQELEREPDHWFRALVEITQTNPVPLESQGKLREMTKAWVTWGLDQGYRW